MDACSRKPSKRQGIQRSNDMNQPPVGFTVTVKRHFLTACCNSSAIRAIGEPAHFGRPVPVTATSLATESASLILIMRAGLALSTSVEKSSLTLSDYSYMLLLQLLLANSFLAPSSGTRRSHRGSSPDCNAMRSSSNRAQPASPALFFRQLLDAPKPRFLRPYGENLAAARAMRRTKSTAVSQSCRR
jgi:hypothetical protein